MKRAICFLFGHDWIESELYTQIVARIAGLASTMYKCRRCGTPGFR